MKKINNHDFVPRMRSWHQLRSNDQARVSHRREICSGYETSPTGVTRGPTPQQGLIAGQKRRANVNLPSHRFGLPANVDLSEIVTEAGDRFIVTNTQSQGARKKCRIALDLRTGQAFADLEFRTAASAPYTTKYGGQQTWPTSLIEVQTTLRALERHGRIVPKQTIVVDRSGGENKAQKVHLLVTLMTENVYGAVDRIESPPLKSAFVRRVAVELARDLKRLHLRGEMHGDLKLENALVCAERGIAISDLDTVRDQRLGRRPGLLPRATCPAPEMVRGAPYGSSSDIWMLGVALGDAYNKSGVFCSPRFRPPQAEAFELFHSSLFTPWGAFRARHLLRGTDEFSAYFQSFYEADAQLCEVALRRMIQPDPGKRSLAERELLRLCKPGTPTYASSETAIKVLDESHYRKAVESALKEARAVGVFDRSSS